MLQKSKIFLLTDDTRVTYINKPLNQKWSNWKLYKDCSEKERQEINLAGYPNSCILFDKDYRDSEGKPLLTQEQLMTEYRAFKKLLFDKNIKNFVSWASPAGFHILAPFINFNKSAVEMKKEIKRKLILELNCDLAKVSDLGVVSMPGRPHFKDSKIYNIIEDFPGENILPEDLITEAENNLKAKAEAGKVAPVYQDEDFKDYFNSDPFFKYIKDNIIPDGTNRDNIIFPNLAIAAVKSGLTKSEIDNLLKPIIENNFPGKNYAEFLGWFRKALIGETKDYNYTLINRWMKEHTSEENLPYDLKPISILEEINKMINESPAKTAALASSSFFKSDKTLAEEPETDTEWLIEKWLPAGDICFLAGKAASFKTTVALHMAFAVSKGKLFFNKYQCKQGKVLYINEENYKKLFKNYIKRVKTGLDLTENDEDVYFSIMENLQLEHTKNLKAIIEFVKANNIKLIIFDSFRRFFLGEENDAGVVNFLFSIFKYIRSQTGDPTIVVLHHAKKDTAGTTSDIRDILRGSSDIVNSADSVIGIKRKHGADLITVEHIKNRSGEELVGKVIKVDPGENNDMVYFYETSLEANRANIKDMPEQCADDIEALIKTKNLTVFTYKDLQEVAEKHSRSSVKRALKILIEGGQLTTVGIAPKIKYVAVP